MVEVSRKVEAALTERWQIHSFVQSRFEWGDSQWPFSRFLNSKGKKNETFNVSFVLFWERLWTDAVYLPCQGSVSEEVKNRQNYLNLIKIII